MDIICNQDFRQYHLLVLALRSRTSVLAVDASALINLVILLGTSGIGLKQKFLLRNFCSRFRAVLVRPFI
ncbi:hypothetical protein Q1695_015355 [Nippostrongylus brasiliensis]|nr:hypothetical protein Q1695_015355 [Nippostrongylus brasiliensis]